MNFKSIPKIELHLHLDGSIRQETIAELLDIKKKEVENKIVAPSKCNDLNDYLTKFSLPISVMQTKENLERIAYELVCDLEKENVLYAEIRFAPIKHVKELTLDEVVSSVLNGLKKGNVKTNLILCMMRDSSYKENVEIIKLTKKYLNKGVVAIDLAGAEAIYKTELFGNLFLLANSNHIPFTIHAGEADGVSNIKSAIEFGAKRIGHGIRAVEDQNIMNEIMEREILLEICPTSNIQTDVVHNYSDHPIKKLFDWGCKISINTDNRTVSNTTLEHEYKMLNKYLGFTTHDIIKTNIDAIHKSFLKDEEKKELLDLYLNKLE